MNLKDLIYLPRCPFCGKLQKENNPCDVCASTAKELTGQVCNRCGAEPEHCCCNELPVLYERNISCFYYKDGPRKLLLRFKLRRCPQLAPFIAHRMACHIKARYPFEFQSLCYVPGARKTFRERGYFHTRLMAEYLSSELELPVVNCLERVNYKQQKRLNAAQRRKNARESYRLKKGTTLRGKVLLIDDLITTGATLSVCAELLKKGGAESVYTATFAITQKNS